MTLSKEVTREDEIAAMGTYKVFVYGTLLKGEENHNAYLSGSRFVCCADLPGYGLYNVDVYPGIVPEEGERVKGEVYEVDQATLRRLDDLEDEGDLYTRREVIAETAEGPIKVLVYVWNGDVDADRKVDYTKQPWRGLGI